MPDPTDPTPLTLASEPPPAEAADERIRRLEEMVARLTRAVEPPQGYSPAAHLPLSAADVPPAPGAPPPRWYSSIFRELKLIVRMYLDPRYRLSRIAQFGVPLAFALMVLNYFLFAYLCFGGIPILSPIGERLLNLILAVGGYSILRKETVRYQAVLDYLARTGRG